MLTLQCRYWSIVVVFTINCEADAFNPPPQADKKDPQCGACMPGFEILLQKQLKGKQMQKEMSEFVHERYGSTANPLALKRDVFPALALLTVIGCSY